MCGWLVRAGGGGRCAGGGDGIANAATASQPCDAAFSHWFCDRAHHVVVNVVEYTQEKYTALFREPETPNATSRPRLGGVKVMSDWNTAVN